MNALAPSVLTIDLRAIVNNYNKLKSFLLPPCFLSAVVKANAYGLGVEEVAKTLHAAGADLFFVATIDEAIELRKFTDARIATLNGYFRGAEREYDAFNIIPVLCSIDEVERWRSGKCYWQVDTGMNRLGIRADEFETAFNKAQVQPSLVISHLASADIPSHAKNTEQLEIFSRIAQENPLLKYSLANSSGIFLGPEYHFNIVRPGMALYGLNPTPETANPMESVISLKTRILQVSKARIGETTGYGASARFYSDARIATVSLGYADGFLRSGSNRASLYWQGIACPVLGRVSMDLITVDLSDLPVSVLPPFPGDFMEVIGPHQSAEMLASDLGTISYEILTSLSQRSHRIYKSLP